MKHSVRIQRSAAWLLLLPVLLSASAVCGDDPNVASWRPTQGTVYDGTSASPSTWYVDFSDAGFQIEHLVPMFLCPGAPRDVMDEVLRLAPERVVFQIGATVAAFQGFRFLARLDLPPAVAALSDDCDVLDAFETVQGFLQYVTERSASILAQIDTYLDELRDAYCDARSAILDAPLISSEEEGFLPPLGGGGGGSPGDPVPPLCSKFRYRLNTLVATVNAMSVRRQMCAALLDQMEEAPDYIAQRIADLGGLTVDEQKLALAGIDMWLSAAEAARQEAAALHADVTAGVGSFTLEAVSLSCAGCATGAAAPTNLVALDGSFPAEEASPSVLVRRDREPLERYVRSLWCALRHARDRQEARRLASLALRLSCVPSCRVLHVTWRGTSGIGQEYVALRAPCRRGSWGALWAVVLTVLPVDAPLPDPTPADHDRMLDGIDAFNAMLADADTDEPNGASRRPTSATRRRWNRTGSSWLPGRRRR